MDGWREPTLIEWAVYVACTLAGWAIILFPVIFIVWALFGPIISDFFDQFRR